GEREIVDVDRARLQHNLLAVAGEIVGTLALDLDGGEFRRHLRDRSGEGGETGPDGVRGRTIVRGCDDTAFRIVGVALLAPAYREAIALAPVHHERDGLGRLAERERQDA